MEPCGPLWTLRNFLASVWKVAHPQGTVQNSIQTCTSFYKLGSPFGAFLQPFRISSNHSDSFRTLEILTEPSRTLWNLLQNISETCGLCQTLRDPQSPSDKLRECLRSSENRREPQKCEENPEGPQTSVDPHRPLETSETARTSENRRAVRRILDNFSNVRLTCSCCKLHVRTC